MITAIADAEAGSSVRAKLNTLIAGYNTSRIDAARDFGVVGDGSTNNSTALIAMRDAMIADPGPLHRVYFPPGDYKYDNNRWLMGVRRYEIEAYGCRFTNTLPASGGPPFSPWGLDRQPLNNRNPFDNRGDTTGGPLQINGYRINGAVRQAASVTCTTAGDAANFAVGNRVLIYGYPQQFTSDPPNARYFEYNQVTSVNAGTGVIGLLRRLQYDYDANWGDWWDTVNQAPLTNGKPRIVSLDRANFVQSDISIIRGATFPQRPDEPTVFFAFFLSSDYQEMDACTARHPTASCTRFQVYRNCTFEDVEVDKLIETCLIEDCRLTEAAGSGINGSLVSAQGVNKMHLRRNILDGVVRLGARYLLAEDNDFYSSVPDDFAALKGEARPVLHASIRHNRFHNVLGSVGDTGYPGNLGYCVGFDVNNFTVDAISGTSILVAFGDDESKVTVGRLMVGQTLICPANSKSGKVTSITDDGAGNVVIAGTWAAPVAGESWRYYQCETLDLADNIVIGTQIPVLNPIKNVWRTTRDRTLTLNIPTAANATYALLTEAENVLTLDRLSIICASGTVTAKVQITGVDVTGLTAVAVSSTRARAYTTGTANRCPLGGRITLVLSSNSAAVDVEVGLLVRPD